VNFLNVGPWELTVILIIAILLIGPRRVVEIVQTMGRLASRVRSMSSEFTALIQSEVRSSDDQSASATDSHEEAQGTGPELGDELREMIRPIANVQAELRATVQETRQAMESIVEGELGSITDIQTELQDAVQGGGAIADIQTELQSAAQEARQAMEAGSVGRVKPEPKERQDDKEAKAD